MRGDDRAAAAARRSIGREAEDAAAAFLERAGLRVVERNVRFAEGKIDLVCRDRNTWVFVEVKCRQASWGDAPAAAVSWVEAAAARAPRPALPEAPPPR